MPNNPMQQFINRLIIEAGLDAMPADFQADYAARLMQEAEKRMGIAAMAELGPKQIEEFEKIRKDGKAGADEINDFLVQNIENFPEKMAQALEEFRQSVLASAKRLNK